MSPIEAVAATAVVEVADDRDVVVDDLDSAIQKSADEAAAAAKEKEAEERQYKEALANSLADVKEGSQLADAAFLLQGLAPGAASSGTEGGSSLPPADGGKGNGGGSGSTPGASVGAFRFFGAGRPAIPELVLPPSDDKGNAAGNNSAPATPLSTETTADSGILETSSTIESGATAGSGKCSVGAPPPQDIDLSLLCGDCNHPLKKRNGVRFLRKAPDGGKVYQCGGCNNKCVGLRREFGTWPIEEYKALPEEEKQGFMALASNNASQLKNHLTDMLTKKAIESHKSSMKGQFLPLSVWKAMGWDAERIEATALPEDIENTKLGLTYRVKIHETEEAKLEEKCRSEVLTNLKKYNSKAGKRGRCDSSEDGSSSEQSRDRRRSKKARRGDRRRRRRSSSSRGSRSRSRGRGRAAAKEEARAADAAAEAAGAKAAAEAAAKAAAEVAAKAAANADPKKHAAAMKAAEAAALKEAKKQHAAEKKQVVEAERKLEAERKKAEKDYAAKVNSRKAVCAKAVKAVVAHVIRFDQVVADPRFNSLPKDIGQDAKRIKQALINIKNVAETNMDGREPSAPDAACLAAAHVDVIVKNAPAVLKAIDGFWTAMEKYKAA